MKKSSSSSRCFCVILEVSVYSTFFQHLIQYSVIHTLAAATLFLNYLEYFLSFRMKFQPETIWFLTETKTKYKDQGGRGMNGINTQKHAWLNEVPIQMSTCSSKAQFSHVLCQCHELHPWFSNICGWLYFQSGKNCDLPPKPFLWQVPKITPGYGLWAISVHETSDGTSPCNKLNGRALKGCKQMETAKTLFNVSMATLSQDCS